jgi:outer membrane receptor protein involved in Fe transport
MKYRSLLLVKSLLLVVTLVLVGITPAFGQKVTGDLQGTVTDEQKAVIAGAEVTAKNVGTGSEATTTTNENGVFRLPALLPGAYTVSVTAPGFKRAEVTQLNVRLGVETSVDVQLQVGGATEVVEVTGAEVVIERETAQISQNFDARKVADLPNNIAGGGVDTVALLTPGVIGGEDAGFGNTNGTSISSNGGRTRSNNFTIDGQDNNDISVTGPSVFITNADVVQEFQVVTNNFSAEYGQASGAIVNLVTKGGTNEYHGSIFEFYRNRKLFDTLTSAERATGQKEADSLLNNTFGVAGGGPISKDRIFFFASYQGIREAQSFLTRSNSNGLTPTPNGINTLIQFADPAIGNILKVVAPFNQPLGNPQIQPGTTRIIPITIKGQAIPVEFSGIQRTIPTPFEENLFTGRVDWNISDKLRFFGRYIYQKEEFGNVTGRFTGGYVVDVPSRSQQVGGTLVYQVSPRAFNELRINYSRLRVFFGNNSVGNVPSADQADQAVANFTLPSGFLALGTQTNLPQGRLNDNYQFQDNFSLILGRHSLKMGADIKRRLTDSLFLPTLNGSFTFTTLTRFAENNPNTASIAFGEPQLNFTETDQFYFFQDDVRVRDNLTLNLGIRYENTGQPINRLNEITRRREADASTAFFNPALPLEARIVPRIDTDSNNFAPRIGFAYTPRFAKAIFGENKTVIRGGFGIAYDVTFYNILLNVSTASPAVLSTTIVGVQGLVPNSPFGPAVRASIAPRVPLRTQDPRQLRRTTVSDDFHSPYNQQFSFGIQRQFGQSTVAEARYVGARSIGQFQSVNGNPLIRGLVADFPQFLPPGTNAAPNGRARQEGIEVRRINGATSDYHSLQLQLQTRLADQLTLGVAYTYSKQLDNASEIFSTFGGGNTVTNAQNPFDLVGGERSFGAFDVRNNLAVNFIYDVPLFRNQQGLVGKVLGGYQLSGTYFARDGQRYTPSIFAFGSPYTDFAFGGVEPLRPFLANRNAPVGAVAIDDVTLGESSPTGYFSLNAFNATGALVPVTLNDVRFVVNTGETALRFGNPYGDVARNTLKGDDISRGNFGIFKNTKVSERLNIQFRAEFFNVFNHPNFGVPDPFIDDAGVGFADPASDNDGTGGGRRRIQFGLKLVF